METRDFDQCDWLFTASTYIDSIHGEQAIMVEYLCGRCSLKCRLVSDPHFYVCMYIHIFLCSHELLTVGLTSDTSAVDGPRPF